MIFKQIQALIHEHGGVTFPCVLNKVTTDAKVFLSMEHTAIVFWMTAVGTGCWIVCFWWMHRISSRQNALLQKIQEQGKRIEELARMEHELIKEVHPQVSEIKEQLDEVAETVSDRGGS